VEARHRTIEALRQAVPVEGANREAFGPQVTVYVGNLGRVSTETACELRHREEPVVHGAPRVGDRIGELPQGVATPGPEVELEVQDGRQRGGAYNFGAVEHWRWWGGSGEGH